MDYLSLIWNEKYQERHGDGDDVQHVFEEF